MNSHTRNVAVIGFIFALLSWIFLTNADAYAWYKFDWNACNSLGGPCPGSWWDYPKRYEARALLVFLPPAVALIFLHGAKKLQWSILFLLGVFVAIDLMQLLALEGGDRKGCEGCFGLFLCHIVFNLVAVTLVVAHGLFYAFCSMVRVSKRVLSSANRHRSDDPRWVVD
jgi:hypothetical protein